MYTDRDKAALKKASTKYEKPKNKRGRTTTNFTSYYRANMAKIAQKKRLIADPTVDRETKYKYRNQISAL